MNPRVLIVTPEIAYLPKGMGFIANILSAKAGGLGDVSAALIGALFNQGADIHVAMPDYRAIFKNQIPSALKIAMNRLKSRMPEERIHLASDRAFYYQNRVYSDLWAENLHIALAFQREVINNIIPYVQPDLIHCNDWMTGLIPAFAREIGIPSLFTLHNIHTLNTTLEEIEDKGIDAAEFWQQLYYDRMPYNYEETRASNNVDMLTSGVFAAHYVNTVSPTFLKEIVEGKHDFIPVSLRQELKNKWQNQCASGVLNAPAVSFNPLTDEALVLNYDEETHVIGKKTNKRYLQEKLGLKVDSQAPLFFWPHRLDAYQKGCHLLSEILYEVVSQYWEQNLQIIFVADGEYCRIFKDIVNFNQFHDRVVVYPFDEHIARLAYASADYMLMPSRFEPCGLPQMIAPLYGTLPVAYNTGGIHDTVTHLYPEKNTGNGFLFEHYDANGLKWAIDQAMLFYWHPPENKNTIIRRVMRESLERFNHSVTAGKYIELYEKMLKRQLVPT